MLTGELRSKIDAIWNAFWTGGIANPLEVIEQITYLLFLRRLDDLQLLAKVVDLIDQVPMDSRDTRRDLYEYMLGKIASAGQNGQFRIPRHIIQLMVAMTALRSVGGRNLPGCKSVCAVHISVDSWLIEPLWAGKSPQICTHAATFSPRKFLPPTLPARKTSFAPRPAAQPAFWWRAAVIVPDGVLFGSSKAHKALRRMLVEEHKLDAVVSLPGGVFKPYAGVSTVILLFTNPRRRHQPRLVLRRPSRGVGAP